MKIGIAGIGGIGSNVARHLAQARVESLKIVDQDLVDASNLNRQFYRMSQVGQKKTDSLEENLKDIFPGMIIEKTDMTLGPGDAGPLFSDCDIVVEGFDDKALKKMIIEELSPTGKLLVSASGIAGRDMTGVTIKKMGHCHIVGDLLSDQADFELFGPKVIFVSALMAGIVLTHIKEKKNE
ncbi:MAG: sulfur carrier protein ThiS adenylyltransferase ThiF [Desulfobacula sp.]|jgi:sulfur carrier protein ThiS adenylyltransferase